MLTHQSNINVADATHTLLVIPVLLLVLLSDSLKSSIEQRRVAMAMQGLVSHDSQHNQNFVDPKEEELKGEIEKEKEW